MRGLKVTFVQLTADLLTNSACVMDLNRALAILEHEFAAIMYVCMYVFEGSQLFLNH